MCRAATRAERHFAEELVGYALDQTRVINRQPVFDRRMRRLIGTLRSLNTCGTVYVSGNESKYWSGYENEDESRAYRSKPGPGWLGLGPQRNRVE